MNRDVHENAVQSILPDALTDRGGADPLEGKRQLLLDLWKHYTWLYESGEYGMDPFVVAVLRECSSLYLDRILSDALFQNPQAFESLADTILSKMLLFPDSKAFIFDLLELGEYIQEFEYLAHPLDVQSDVEALEEIF